MTEQEQEAHDLALGACRQQGCTCDVKITIELVEGLDAPAAVVQHNDWCPLLRTMQERPPAGRWQAVLHPR